MPKRKKGIILKIMWTIVVVLAIVAGIGAFLFYKEFLKPNIRFPGQPYLYIPPGSTFEDVVKILSRENLLVNEKTFRWTADRLKYTSHVKPGKYLPYPPGCKK